MLKKIPISSTGGENKDYEARGLVLFSYETEPFKLFFLWLPT